MAETVKKFSVGKAKDPIKFEVDEDSFEAISPDTLPAGALASYFEQIGDGKLFSAHDDLFKVVLTEESYERFAARLNSKENPITIQMLGEISAWLLGEKYMGEGSGESKG